MNFVLKGSKLPATCGRTREAAAVHPAASRSSAAPHAPRTTAPLAAPLAPLAPRLSRRAPQAATAEAPSVSGKQSPMAVSQIGLVGLAVMGQNMALNVAEKGFPISVYNRSFDKTEAAVKRAQKEGLGDKLRGFETVKDFVMSLEKPRRVIILVKAGAPVDQTIAQLSEYMEPGDIIIDGGNEWYENTEKRMKAVAEKGLLYLGMGVSGGEEGARNGPSMMPGGSPEAYSAIESIVKKVAAQVDSGPCVMYIGGGGAGNFVKMVHNGIEYGDMQLISEAYDVLKTLGGLDNEELAAVFTEWNQTELKSFLVEITAIIMNKKDDQAPGYLVDMIVDKTGSKGTGKWTVQQAAELAVAAPTMASALDARYMSALKSQRVEAAKVCGAVARLPANLVQAQRDFFGSHTYERADKAGWYHTVWDESFGSADSATTSGYVV
ncbi:6-phosphogluconate dehydrogenase, decarboxylating [Tetrabaena socialis]|uniref:phosphogluconate dehydrogenase (NADP(+)-dependent, decarboxylating) n=1 Tax=Tetrabaena socialis TaxID=47790 RepID=A0A2J7ZUV3_9CHLO|nr:6-phosphogluconate dehydrogenase, decarboxylating [Tetrabaena socialis]|eukprot:PNH04030.1 6-phosphogluconate dehydrogenase, decarboxylating [Tetrabaena socialis]